MLIVRRVFGLFSNPRKSFHAFSPHLGKNLGKKGIFTNEILAQKMRTVKSTLDGWNFLSKHREMTAHSTEAWEFPKPTTCNV